LIGIMQFGNGFAQSRLGLGLAQWAIASKPKCRAHAQLGVLKVVSHGHSL
jgi:hypothetical protein